MIFLTCVSGIISFLLLAYLFYEMCKGDESVK